MSNNFTFIDPNNVISTYSFTNQDVYTPAPGVSVANVTYGVNVSINTTSIAIQNSTVGITIKSPNTVQSLSGVYFLNANGNWTTASVSGTVGVTGVGTGAGLTGGPITTTGAVSVLANTGIVANTTGTYVNAAYISTITANNASYLGGAPYTAYVNTSGSYTVGGIITHSGNLVFSTGALIANGSPGTIGQTLISNGSGVYWSTATGMSGLNTFAQYTFSNTVGFGNTVSLAAGLYVNNSTGTVGQILTSGGSYVYWANIALNSYTWSNTQTFSNAITFNGNVTATSNTTVVNVYSNGTINVNGYITVNANNSVVRQSSFGGGEINFIPYLSGAANNIYYMNLCDTYGSNGANMTLNIRGLGTGGSVGATLTAVTVTATALNCTGDVVSAYSDERLKDKLGNITDALSKVKALSGFIYRPNRLALESSIASNDSQRVGVSAQEVKEVLPEAVMPSPANSEFLTVDYDKLVPLLIEAIKELDSKIDKLKS